MHKCKNTTMRKFCDGLGNYFFVQMFNFHNLEIVKPE